MLHLAAVQAMGSRYKVPTSPSSPSHLAALFAFLWIPHVSSAPASDLSSTTDIPQATAQAIVSPIPPAEFKSSTHLSTYGIVGIVISAVLFTTVVIGYSLRSWKRYKRSRLPPSAQYRESLRVAAKEEGEAAEVAGATARSARIDTREVGGGSAGSGAGAAARKSSSKSGARRGEGVSRDTRAKRPIGSSSRKPTGEEESKSRRESKSRSVRWSDTGPSATGPGSRTQAPQPQSHLSGIEEVPR